jgi:hypothetical protein
VTLLTVLKQTRNTSVPEKLSDRILKITLLNVKIVSSHIITILLLHIHTTKSNVGTPSYNADISGYYPALILAAVEGSSLTPGPTFYKRINKKSTEGLPEI